MIKFDKIKITNWKCWKTTETFNFDLYEVIKRPNGTGKTSLFQAVMYAITGKAPTGFNLNTVRNDDSKNCDVEFWFSDCDNNLNFYIHRIFGNKSLSEFYCNDVLIADSIREVNFQIEKIIGKPEIFNLLFTDNLTNVDFMNLNFLKENIFNEALKTPITLITSYKKDKYALSRELKNVNSKLDGLGIHGNVSEIQKEIDQLKEKLKNVSEAPSDVAYKLALGIEEKIKTLEGFDFNGVDKKKILEDLSRFSKNNIFHLEKLLQDELARQEDVYGFTINERYGLKSAINKMLVRGECFSCGTKLTEKERSHAAEFLKFLENDKFKDIDKISALQNEIEWHKNVYKNEAFCENEISSFCENEEITEEAYNRIITKWKNILKKFDIKSEIESFEKKYGDCAVVIEKHKEETGKVWELLERKEKELKVALEVESLALKAKELEKELEKCRIALAILEGFIQSSIESMSQSISNLATRNLQKINSPSVKYQEIHFYDGEFYVIAEDEETGAVDMLPIARPSKGEKTVISLCMLFALHELYLPNIPFLFDEAFANLDQMNRSLVSDILQEKSHVTQMFVITHEMDW